MNGIVYCRVSSKEQIEGTSLESQQAACLEYAQAKGIEVLRVFIEQGESAKFADRTQLIELIDFCRTNKGNVQVLLVWKVDRFARNVTDHYSVKATLAKYGVRIASVTEPIDANPEGKLMETILAGFAQFDNDIRAARTVQGMRRKIQEGIFPWGAPFGYKRNVADGEKKNLPDVPDEPTFSLLQKAWKLFAHGGYSQAEVGRLMESWGLSSAHGRAFSPQSLYQLFTNPYYSGILVDPWTGQEYEGKHVPLVTRTEFAAAQQVVNGRTYSVAHQKEREEFPLRGVVRCSACLRPMTAGISKGRSARYSYYRCHRRPCPKYGKGFTVDTIHAEFEQLLTSIAPKEGFLEKLGAMIEEEASRRQSSLIAVQHRRRERLGRIDRNLSELVRMRVDGLLTDDEFARQKQEYLKQRYSIENKELSAIDVLTVRGRLTEIVTPITRLPETWRSLELTKRRRFQQLIVPTGIVHEQVGTAELGLLFSTFRTFPKEDSSVVPSDPSHLNRISQEIQVFWEILHVSASSPDR